MLHPEDLTDPFPVFWPDSWPHPDRLRERLPYWLEIDGILAAGEVLGEAGMDCDPIAFAQMAGLTRHLAPVQLARNLIALTLLEERGLGSVA